MRCCKKVDWGAGLFTPYCRAVIQGLGPGFASGPEQCTINHTRPTATTLLAILIAAFSYPDIAQPTADTLIPSLV